ncbi:MAG TPA: hypothetical protein VKZ70_13830 [Burkholderiaceae bacterium]|nr:hypothetical protein [Burkholderiaceae bacterium]
MRFLIQLSIAALLVTGISAAHANQSLEVVVKKVDASVVTVESKSGLPLWLNNDTRVLAAGWESSVKLLDGSTFELHFDASQQGVVQPETDLIIRHQSPMESDGLTCG